MPLMTLEPKLRLGVQDLDEDHEKLFAMYNQFVDGLAAGQSHEILVGYLDALIHITLVHFQHEEKIFVATHYPGAAEHQKEHHALILEASKICDTIRQNSHTSISFEMANFFKDWMLYHIQHADQKYADFLRQSGTLSDPGSATEK